MSNQIKFFAIGGLDEKDRQCYVLDINGDIVLINCGVSTPPNISLGLQKITIDHNWISSHKDAIKGILIGFPSYANYGGIEYILNLLPNIKIYTTNIGKTIIETHFENLNIQFNNFHVIKALEEVQISSLITMVPFGIINSIPNSVGFIFKNNDGNILYLDDFIYSPNISTIFCNDINNLPKLSPSTTLLINTTGQTGVFVGQIGKNECFTNPNYKLNDFYNKTLNSIQTKAIVSMFEDDVYKFISLVNYAVNKNLPLYINSKKFINILNCLNESKQFNKKIKLINKEEASATKQCIVIIAEPIHIFFNEIDKILFDEEQTITLTPEDIFIHVGNTISGYEKYEAQMFDDIYKKELKNIFKLDENILPMQPSNEDHKLLVNSLKPKYIIPTNNKYVNLKEYQKIIKQTGFDIKNVLILENGEIVEIIGNEKQIIKNKEDRYIQLKEQYIGGKGGIESNSESLFEREQMKESGCVLISLVINLTKKTIEHSNFDVIGVINLNDENKGIINEINTETSKKITDLLKNNQQNKLDIKELKLSIRKIVAKQYQVKFNKKPLILVTIIIQKHNYYN